MVCIVSASAYAARRCKYSLFFNPLISKHPFEKAGWGRVVYTVGHNIKHGSSSQTWLFVGQSVSCRYLFFVWFNDEVCNKVYTRKRSNFGRYFAQQGNFRDTKEQTPYPITIEGLARLHTSVMQFKIAKVKCQVSWPNIWVPAKLLWTPPLQPLLHRRWADLLLSVSYAVCLLSL